MSEQNVGCVMEQICTRIILYLLHLQEYVNNSVIDTQMTKTWRGLILLIE